MKPVLVMSFFLLAGCMANSGGKSAELEEEPACSAIYDADCPRPETALWMEQNMGLTQISNATRMMMLQVGERMAFWLEGGMGLPPRFVAYDLETGGHHVLGWTHCAVQDGFPDGLKVAFSYSPCRNGKSDTRNNSVAVWPVGGEWRGVPGPPGVKLWAVGYDDPWILAQDTTMNLHRPGLYAINENGTYRELWPRIAYGGSAQGGPLRGWTLTEGHAFLSFWRPDDGGRLTIVDHDLEAGTRTEIANWTAGPTSILRGGGGWIALPVTVDGESGWWTRHVSDGQWQRIDTPASYVSLGGDVMFAFELDHIEQSYEPISYYNLVAYHLRTGESQLLLHEDGFKLLDWGTNGEQLVVLLEPRPETHLMLPGPQYFVRDLPPFPSEAS